MRISVTLAFVAVLAGCGPSTGSGGDDAMRHGRYVGVGLYSAGRLWAQIKHPDATAKASDAATLAEDSTIIVVADSVTGEVRQCGDLSGFCTTMNPWTKQALGAPVALNKRRADLETDTVGENTTGADPAD